MSICHRLLKRMLLDCLLSECASCLMVDLLPSAACLSLASHARQLRYGKIECLHDSTLAIFLSLGLDA